MLRWLFGLVSNFKTKRFTKFMVLIIFSKTNDLRDVDTIWEQIEEYHRLETRNFKYQNHPVGRRFVTIKK